MFVPITPIQQMNESNMPDEPDRQLPYLQSARHFHIYEPYIQRIVMNWPQLSVFKPDSLTVETLATRLRICIRAHREHGHDSVVPYAKFLEICDEIVVSTAAQPGTVVCGPFDLVRKKVPLGTQVEAEITQVVPKVNLVDPDHDLVKAILVLHHHRLLSEPSVITTNDLNYINSMKLLYDVSVSQEGNKFTIL